MIQGLKTLWQALSVTITQGAYPMIPRLYDLFMYFATEKFMDNDFVYSVWKNIYVLVGVIVLFAIAVRLISAIVNPDLAFDDKNKKGLKATYLRVVIAVILIFIFPMAFKLSVEVQDDLVNSNKLYNIFGLNIEQKELGQTLAWETFSSFCVPVDNIGNVFYDFLRGNIGPIGNAVLYEYYMVSVNIDNVRNLDTELFWDKILYSTSPIGIIGEAGDMLGASGLTGGTSELTGTYHHIEYHSFLCPLIGCLVVYELIILCMDTFFRTLKLSFLQMILPIVLGAFIFDPEILKRWGKEYLSTFLELFLKILALGFAIVALQYFRAKGVL